MKKRLLSLVLAAVLVLSLVPGTAFAAEVEANGYYGGEENGAVDSQAEDVSVVGTDSVGTLIASTLQGEEDEQNSMPCCVQDIIMDGTMATVEFVVDQDALIVVAIYDEDSGQMLGSGSAQVTGEDETEQVEIKIPAMPEYYVVKAFLLSSGDSRPLAPEFTSRMYTKPVQEFLATTTEDYDADRVLNLDEDETTNFLVFSEDTVLLEESAETNIITDNGDGTYTITNADAAFLSLAPGGSFACTYDDGTVLIVVIESVSVDGTTVTVTEKADATLEDVFDVVKIEAETDGEGSTVDKSTLGEGVTLEEDGTLMGEVGGEVGTSHTFSINLKTDKGVLIKGSVGFSVGVKFKLYWAWWGYLYTSCAADYSADLSVSVSDKAEWAVPLGDLYFPIVPGLDVVYSNELVLSVSAEIKMSGKLSGSFGVAFDKSSPDLCVNSFR